MVRGQLSIVVSACLIRSNDPQRIVQAVLHAQIGQQYLQTKPVRSQIKKQLAWQQKLLFKVENQRVARFWLTDELRKGEQQMEGECVINLSTIKSQKFPLFLFWKQKETAVIDVEFVLDTKGGKYVDPEKRTKRYILKFLVRDAVLSKDMELIGSMRPTVRISVGRTTHQTLDGKGKTPLWDQEIIFQSVKKTDDVLITVLDKELLGKDDVIGTIRTNLQSLKTERTYNLDIGSKGEVVGTLRFDLKHYFE